MSQTLEFTFIIEENEIFSNDENTAQVLNTFFSNIVGSLNIPEFATNDTISDNISDSIIKLIVKYRKQSSILARGEVCKERKEKHAAFLFKEVAKEKIFADILNLDVSKVCQDTDIPFKIIKEKAYIFASFLHPSFNASVTNSEFPSVLKQANITLIFKKRERYSKDNYRPVSILPNEPRIFKRCMIRQINKYVDVFLSRHQCGFKKGYSTQQCLLAMPEKWKSTVDNKKNIWALLANLSRAFDWLSHELFLAKLHAYGLSIPARRLVYSYLKNRRQRTKINSAYSSWEEILFGVPQGTIIGPLLSNIFLCDLFYMMCDTDFAGYADDNTTYISADTNIFKWFADNQMKANEDKCHLIVSKNENVSMHIGPFEIKTPIVKNY